MTGLIAHEWIATAGGSENVLAMMASAYPEADIACLWNDDPAKFSPSRVQESWLARSPLRGRKAMALPLMPSTWRSTSLRDYDWALVSSHAFAHHIGSRSERRQKDIFAYVHTPARYIWAADFDERGQGTAARALGPYFRNLDRRRALEGPVYAANSEFIRQRIGESWGVDSSVIYPPVSIERIRSVTTWQAALCDRDAVVLERLPESFVLGASRFVQYKKVDEAIKVGELLDLPVVLAGRGPDEARLRARAAASGIDVYFVDRPSDELLYALYERATLFVFAAVEDFGIMPVEAMALGTPVLVNQLGGASESVKMLAGGCVSNFRGGTCLRQEAERAIGIDMSAARKAADIFSEKSFTNNLLSWMRVKSPSYPPGH